MFNTIMKYKFLLLIKFLEINIMNIMANYEVYYMDDNNFCRRNGTIINIGQEVYKSTIILRAIQSSFSYRPSLKCSAIIKSPHKFGIIVTYKMVIL
jgi:hypothetical protein